MGVKRTRFAVMFVSARHGNVWGVIFHARKAMLVGRCPGEPYKPKEMGLRTNDPGPEILGRTLGSRLTELRPNSHRRQPKLGFILVEASGDMYRSLPLGRGWRRLAARPPPAVAAVN